MPWDFAELPRRKKAALIAMIKARIETEKKKAAAQPKGGGKKSGRRRR